MIPLLFGNNKTIEFRIHVPSNNPIKIINWMLICSAIIKYAEIVKKSNVELSTLKSTTLKNVIETVYHNDYVLITYLLKYIDYRKHLRIYADENCDYVGATEISEDSSYSKDF